MTQPSTVKLTRYIRPRRMVSGFKRDIDSQQGVTLNIELDYSRRLIDVQYAICNHSAGEPSFSKDLGRQYAATRVPITLPMWEGPSKLVGTDLTEYVVGGLNSVAPIGISRSDLHRINQMYMKAASRPLNT